MAMLKDTFSNKLKFSDFYCSDECVVLLNSSSLFDHAITFVHDLAVIYNSLGTKLYSFVMDPWLLL